jgi:hypothetical protein
VVGSFHHGNTEGTEKTEKKIKREDQERRSRKKIKKEDQERRSRKKIKKEDQERSQTRRSINERQLYTLRSLRNESALGALGDSSTGHAESTECADLSVWLFRASSFHDFLRVFRASVVNTPLGN